jgi:hypothetical protein
MHGIKGSTPDPYDLKMPRPPLALIDALRMVIDYVEATRSAGRSAALYLLLEEIACELSQVPAEPQGKPRPQLVPYSAACNKVP